MSRPEGEITRKELINTSREAFGKDNYGELAADILATVQRASWINVRQFDRAINAAFEFSPYHFGDNEIRPSRDLFQGTVSRISPETIERRLRVAMRDEQLFFDYMFVANPDRHTSRYDPIAHMVPLPWQKEDLARFMMRPAPDTGGRGALATNQVTGATGRALDVLSLVSGVKTDVNPNDTDAGETVDYTQFRNEHLKQMGVTPAVRRRMHKTLRIAVMREVMSGRSTWLGDDVAIEGQSHVRGVGFSKEVEIDRISIASLKAFGERSSNAALRKATDAL